MFGRIARGYDRANRVLSGGIDLWWRRTLVRDVARAHPKDVLDLATGSGDVVFALTKVLPRETAILGMDFCVPMLDVAREKQAKLPPERVKNVTFKPGDGLALPLPDQCVDAVTISFGLRNMADRHRALSEMHRVLRPGGRLFVLEFSQPIALFRPLYYLYIRYISPRMAGALTGDASAYDYLCNSIEAFPDHLGLVDELAKAGFTGVTATRMTFGVVALHEGTAL